MCTVVGRVYISGSVARIDKLCNLIAGLSGTSNKDNVWFALEDTALEIV